MTTFAPLFIPQQLSDAVSDSAWLEAMISAERALVNAEAIAGVVPAHLAGQIAERCRPELYDIAQLCHEGRAAGNPVEPLVRELRTAVGGEAADYVHWGATSQDIIDSAAMLIADRALGLILGWLDEVAAACAALARDHRTTPIAGRTLMQQAVPTTFGLKAAGWLMGAREARALVAHVREQRLQAQLGGAVGTLAPLADRGPEVARLYARELDLRAPVASWHTNRVALIELGAALAAAAAAAAKIAGDIVLLAQTEIAEVAEGAGGGSSTMPHKRNPTASVRALACAARAHSHSCALIAAEPHQHERAASPWHAEWDALTEALAAAGGAVVAVTEALAGLEVDTERMRRNLELTGGLIMAERVAFAAAERVGLGEAQRLVAAAAERSRTEGVSFRGALIDDERLGLSAREIDSALDATVGLEPAAEAVDRLLEDQR